MKAVLTKIGNSQGIIIPAHVIKECQLDHVVSIEIKDGVLMISKPKVNRCGWKEAFAKLDTTLDEELAEFPNAFDEDEWIW